MHPIPPYADHVTVEEFKEWCDTGYVIDYDGSGYYATESEESDVQAQPSIIRQGIIAKEWTHVCWYNK